MIKVVKVDQAVRDIINRYGIKLLESDHTLLKVWEFLKSLICYKSGDMHKQPFITLVDQILAAKLIEGLKQFGSSRNRVG